MRITGNVEIHLTAALNDERKLLQASLTSAMRVASGAVRDELRGQVRAAGIGKGLEKAWQVVTYPKEGKTSLGPAGLVFSKASLLHAVYADGALISARNGRYLAIPTREAEALGFATTNTTRPGPLGSTGTGGIPRRESQVQRAIQRLGAKNVRFVPIQGGRQLVVYHVPDGRGPGRSFPKKVGFKRGIDVPLFVLVPQVRLRPRLDIEGVRSRAGDVLAAQVAAALS